MTSWAGWALRRARASTGLLLTLLALVTATTAILAGAVGYSGAAATTAARQAITGAPPGEAGIRVQTREAEDPAAQDAAARGLIDEAFAPAPVTVQRTVVSPPRPVARDGSRLDGDVVVLASEALTPQDPDAGERVDVVEGDWPQAGTDPLQGLLHAGPAGEWGVSVGDTVEVGGTPVTVVGLWRPVDPGDAYWFGDPLVASGRDGKERGPLLVAPGSVAQLVDAPFVRWTVQPDAREIQPDDLAHLSSAAGSLRSTLKTPEVDVRGVTVEGDLAPTAGTAAHNLATANALGVIPLSVLALVTMLSVIQLARLLATTREAQAQLLVARGATRTQVLMSTIGEAAVVTVVGSTLGALAAWGVLQAVPAGPGQGGTVVRVALLTGLAVLVVLAVVAAIQVRRLTAGGRADLSGRTRAATALATLVLVLGAAGVSWWQLRRNGSPLVTRDDGSLGTDLVAGAAPALLLATAAVVAMALLGPIGRLVETLTRPTRSAAGHLAAAQVARRLPVYAVPAVLTVLAVGATTLSGLYAGTSAALRDNLAAVGQGAPVRATLQEPPKVTADGQVPPAPELPTDLAGTTATAPVWFDETSRLGDLQVPVTMAPTAELAATASLPRLPGGQELVPVGALTATTLEPVAGLEVPSGTREITVAIDVDLTADERDLQGVQEGFEQTVKDVMEGNYGRAQPDEDLAREAARMMMDSQFLEASPETGWGLTLRFVDTTHGLYRTVDGGTVDLTMPTVTLPWTPEVEAGEQVADVDYTRAEITQGGGEGEFTFTLPEDTDVTLVGVDLSRPNERFRSFTPLPPDVDARITARTDDGTDLFGEATAGWGSTTLASPEVIAEIKKDNEGTDPDDVTTTVLPDGSRLTRSLTRWVPGELDTSGTTWTIRQPSDYLFPDDVTIAPGLEYVEDSGGGPPTATTPSQQEEDAPVEGEASTGAVTAALTTATATAANLRVGDRAQLTAFGAQLPIEVVAVVPGVPGSLSATGVLLDRDGVAAAFVEARRTLPYPAELWAMPAGWSGVEGAADARADDATSQVVEELAGQDGVAAVTGPGRVSVTDATSAARLVFWVASAGAVLLAVTGIGAVAATLLGYRRPEVAVLRALGMTPRSQARSRALELGGVVVASVVLGLGASWLVGRAVVPELARSTTLPGQVSLPAQLLLEPGVWAVLMGAGLVVVLLVVLGQATRVRAQALDHDYREEIR